MRSLLVASQKGGVGKTTTAVNLAALAAGAGGRVLLIDADPLGSVAASLQLSRDAGEGPAARPDGVTGKGAAWAGVLPNLDVISPYPADDTTEDRLFEFLGQLPGSPVARFYDRVVLDAPPMPGPRTKALLMAADEVLIVQRAEPMSFRTLPVYLELIREAREGGGECRLRGILLTLPSGVPAGGTAEQKLRERFKGLLPQTIPFDAEINRALVLGKPAVVLNPSCPAAAQYRSLAAALGLIAGAVPAKQKVAVAAGAGAARPVTSEKPRGSNDTPVGLQAATVVLPRPTPAGDSEPAKAIPLSLHPSQKAPAAMGWSQAALWIACGLGTAVAAWFLLK